MKIIFTIWIRSELSTKRLKWKEAVLEKDPSCLSDVPRDFFSSSELYYVREYSFTSLQSVVLIITLRRQIILSLDLIFKENSSIRFSFNQTWYFLFSRLLINFFSKIRDIIKTVYAKHKFISRQESDQRKEITSK